MNEIWLFIQTLIILLLILYLMSYSIKNLYNHNLSVGNYNKYRVNLITQFLIYFFLILRYYSALLNFVSTSVLLTISLKLTVKTYLFIYKWSLPSLSELAPIIFNMDLTHLG